MNTFKTPRFTLITCIIVASTLLSISAAQASISIGVLAPRGELTAMKHWSEFGKYMTLQLGVTVEIKPYSPRSLIPAAKASKVDFMLSNPTLAVILSEVHGATALATLEKESGSQFAGLIIAKKGSGITKSPDLIGKKVIALKFRRAAGAYTFQTYHLYQQGIDPHKDFAAFKEGKKQDDLVLAVNAGIVDAAFIRTGILESMHKEGKINMNDFVVVDQCDKGDYELAHTTDLYPEWYLSVLKGTDTALAEKVKTALLALNSSDIAAQKAKILGFVEPVSMDSMKAALKALKIKPFDK